MKQIFSLAFVLFSISASAQLLQQFNFTGRAGNEVTSPPDGQPVNGFLSPIRRGSGLTASNGANAFVAAGFTTASSPDTADYFQFSIRPNAGFSLKLDSLKLAERRSNTGIRTWSVRSSLDNFSNDISSFNVADTNVFRFNQKTTLGSAFSSLSAANPLVFRIYGYVAEALTGTWRVDSIRIYGAITPTATNPSLAWNATQLAITEGNSGTAKINIAPASTGSITVAVVQKSGTISPADFSAGSINLNAIQISSGSASFDIPLSAISDSNPEPAETAVWVIRSLSSGVSIGADSILNLSISDQSGPNPAPPFTRTIAQIRGANTGNQADSVGRNVRVFGTVYGLNQRLTSAGGGYQMFIRDATGGIGIFKNASVSGITNLNEGDSIKIMGKVEVFRGLSQINPDSMVVLATGRPIKTPFEVNKLNENLEADLVRLNGVQLVSPADWTTGAGTGGFTVRVFKGLDTNDVRIDNDCPLYTQPAPTGTFDIIGMGSQFVPGTPAPIAPFPATGYQLIPRRLSDLITNPTPTAPTCNFAISSQTVNETGDSIRIVLTLSPAATNAARVVTVVRKSGTAVLGTDYTSFAFTTLFFPVGVTSRTFRFGLLDDQVFDGNKTLVVALRKGFGPTQSPLIGPDSIHTISIIDNETPTQSGPPFTRTIAQIRGANTGNQADSVGRNVRVFGTVYGLNQRLTSAGGGYQMFIRDATGGIGIFKNASVSGITNLNEGDSIKIMGKVEVFRGLSQINPDSMVVLATGRPIKTPAEVNKLNENLEADLVRINGVQLVNPAAWTTGTGASGFTVRVFKGLDTTDVRIDNDCPLYNQPAPTGTFDITGMGSQFVSGNPAPVAPFPASGYQLIPRRVSDLISGPPPTDPTCNFLLATQSVAENADSIRIVVNINPIAATATKVNVEIKSGNAVAGTDYTPAASSELTFPAGVASRTFKVRLLDDVVADGNKTLVFALRKGSISPVPSAVIGPDSIQTVTLTDNDTPGPTGPPFTRTIAQIRGANTGNQADSVGRNVRLFGTVYGLNQRLTATTGGYQMFIRDATGGIGIFKNASVSGITNLNEGDSIKIMGKVEVFRGLSQINPDSMVVLATGRPIKTPVEVNKLNENLEADLVRINGVQLVNPAAWTTGTGASGFTVRVFKGLDTTDVRIDNDCPLYNQPAPTGTFDITGMGSQFVSGNPAPVAPFPASGYQLIPRRVSDLIPVVSIDPLCHCEEDIRVYPNPGRENLLLETRSAREFNFEVFNSLGQVVAEFRKTGVVSGISTTAWQSGIYSIRVKETGKIIRWIKS